MAKFMVDIKEIWDATVTVELPESATRAEILAAAKAKFEAEGSMESEYNRTLPLDDWTVRNADGSYVRWPRTERNV